MLLAGNKEEARCGRCNQKDLTIQSTEIVPPFPEHFSEAIASHKWGVSGEEDARVVVTELRSAAIVADIDRYMLVTVRFCRRLRVWAGYPAAYERAFVRNIEANVLRDYFRRTGHLPAGILALNLFEAAVKEAERPKEKALEQHNCAMAVYSMLARYTEKDVILATGRNDIRQEAIGHAEDAKQFFAASKERDSQVQLARILHIIGDLYRAGDSNPGQLQLSLKNLDDAAAIPGIPAQLLENIQNSRNGTESRIESLREAEAQQEEQTQKEFDNPKNLRYNVIGLEGDPEQVAEDLIRNSLPKTQLDEIDIDSQEGLARLFACLMLRMNQASLEKDEIIRFVDRNRRPLKSGKLELLQKLAEAGSHVEGGEKLSRFFEYFSKAVSSALEGRPQDIDLKSDRLLWLLYALGHQLSAGKIDYGRAMAILYKPQHRNRISPLSLWFMLKDFADTIDTASQTPVEYVLLILECAIASHNAPAADATSAVLGRMPAPRDPASFINVMERARELLVAAGRNTTEIDDSLKRYAGRFRREVPDDDF